MGVAYYLTADRPIPGLQGPELPGKDLAHLDDRLASEGVYDQLGVSPLSEFFGSVVDLDEFSEFDEVGEEEDGALSPAVWFSAQEGLDVLSAVRAWLTDHPGFDPRQADALEELAQFEQDLRLVLAHQARWHLSIDI